MNNTKVSKTNTIKPVIVFSLSILAFNPLLVLFYWLGGWEILGDYFFRDSSCGGITSQCLFRYIVVFLLVYFASYSYGIILGLGIMRGVLRMEGNWLGTFAFGLIGAVPTLFILIPSHIYIFLRELTIAIVLGTALAVIVGVAAGFGYFKQGRGFLSWVRVLGVFSGAFFLIIGITYSISALLGYQPL